MNKCVLLGLAVFGLSACSSDMVTEKASHRMVIEQTQVALNSHLWINMMPTIGEVQDRALHGSLYLESEQILPVDMDVKRVMIRQGEMDWTIDGELLELRTHNQNKWEVAFIWQFEINPDYPVDVFLEIESSAQTATLAERGVKVQFVY